MPRTPFETSPAAQGDARKWINPTPGYVGVNIFGADGKPTAVPVEPGGSVWLTEAEERMTAEAPMLPADNPFIKEWDEPTSFDGVTGEATATVRRTGVLTLADEPSRPVHSSRHIPPREQPAKEETVTGAPQIEQQPPVEGQPSPDEVVGTPEAPAKNDEALAQREATAEQKTTPRRRPAPAREEEPLPA